MFVSEKIQRKRQVADRSMTLTGGGKRQAQALAQLRLRKKLVEQEQ
jgi:hypothetical protein